jgi:hypothetical protein
MAFSSASRTATELFMLHGDVVPHGTVDWPGRGARGVFFFIIKTYLYYWIRKTYDTDTLQEDT